MIPRERRKIIIDTDPGVDDAMAIMMALDAHKRKHIEILAITLVKGNASLKDAETNVLRVLEIFELDNIVRLILLYCTIKTFDIWDILKSKLIS